MCYDGKCCCMKLETGTLIFGVIFSVLNAFSVLGCIGGLIAFNVIANQPREGIDLNIGGDSYSYYVNRPTRIPYGVMVGGNVGIVVALLKAVMDFTFTVCLCTGVTKRKPSNIKAYFIYGIVMSVLYSLAIFVLALVLEVFLVGLFGAIGIALYGLILHMVRLTYEKMSSGVVYGIDHKRLQETIY